MIYRFVRLLSGDKPEKRSSQSANSEHSQFRHRFSRQIKWRFSQVLYFYARIKLLLPSIVQRCDLFEKLTMLGLAETHFTSVGGRQMDFKLWNEIVQAIYITLIVGQSWLKQDKLCNNNTISKTFEFESKKWHVFQICACLTND